MKRSKYSLNLAKIFSSHNRHHTWWWLMFSACINLFVFSDFNDFLVRLLQDSILQEIPTNMKKTWLAMIALGAMACACSNDDDNMVPETRILTFTVPDIEASEEEGWIVLSAQDGTVLNAAQLQKGIAYTFEAPGNFKDADLTITIVRTRINNDGQYAGSEIQSYTHVPFGKYETNVVNTSFPEGPPAKDGTSLLVRGLVWEETVNTITMSCPNSRMLSSSPVHEGETEIGVNYYVEPAADQTAILLSRGKEPFQYLYVEVEPGKTYDRSVGDFQEPITRTIEIPKNTEIFSHEVSGWNDYGRFRYSSLSEGVQGTTRLVPKIPEYMLFETTLTALSGTWYDIYKITGDDIPSKMKRLDGPFEYSVNADGLSWKTSGDVDFVQLYAAEYSGYSTAWLAIGPGGDQKIKLPTIPDEVPMQQTAPRTFSALAADYLGDAVLTEYPEFVGYQEALVKLYLDPENTSFPKEQILRFHSDGYIGGRLGALERKTIHFLTDIRLGK